METKIAKENVLEHACRTIYSIGHSKNLRYFLVFTILQSIIVLFNLYGQLQVAHN
jgi:hypothetical protein